VEDEAELVMVGRSNEGRKDEPRRALPLSVDLNNCKNELIHYTIFLDTDQCSNGENA
jgi:hypothetical protein